MALNKNSILTMKQFALLTKPIYTTLNLKPITIEINDLVEILKENDNDTFDVHISLNKYAHATTIKHVLFITLDKSYLRFIENNINQLL